MNIDDYRAIKAQEAKQASQQDQTPVESKQVEPQPQPTQEPVQTEPVKPTEPTPEPVTPTLPEKIAIDGVGEVTIDELKNGYLRTKDYTQKTQDVAKMRKETQEAVNLYEHIKSNPQIAQQLMQQTQLPPTLDPTTSKIIELEQRVYDMMLQNEISTLQSKYSDFEIREVLETARQKGTVNLEDAYLLNKSQKPITPQQPVDMESLKEQVRQEVIKNMEAERQATQTIITTTNEPPVVQDNSPKISEGERKVAKMMNLAEAEYVKWRDAGRK